MIHGMGVAEVPPVVGKYILGAFALLSALCVSRV